MVPRKGKLELALIGILAAALIFTLLMWCRAEGSADVYRKALLRAAEPKPTTTATAFQIRRVEKEIIGADPSMPDAYQARVVRLRRHFADLVQRQRQAPACPAPKPAPSPAAAAPTPGPDDPAGAEGTDDKGVSAEEHRKVRRRLHGLQGYVREHLKAYHGVRAL